MNYSKLTAEVEELMNKGWSDSTKKSYISAIRSAMLPQDALPMLHVHQIIRAFITLKGKPFHRILMLRSALSAYHRINLWPSPPFEAPSLSLFWEGLKRSCTHNVQGTSPITKDQVVQLLAHWYKQNSMVGWARRNASILILQFYLIRRINEVLSASRNWVGRWGCRHWISVNYPSCQKW